MRAAQPEFAHQRTEIALLRVGEAVIKGLGRICDQLELLAHFLKMIEANKSFKVAVGRFAEAAEEAAASKGYTMKDIDVVIPHQANIRIIQGMAKKLQVPMEKVYMTIERYGNISSATVPIALDEAVRDGTITEGKLVVLTAFGGGLTWAGSLLKW